jgi:segregation and condensation protein A
MNMGSGSTLSARPASSSILAARPADLGTPPDAAQSPVRPHAPSPPSPDADRMIFRVDLDVFRGPLDLLLYLVRKHELDITQIPLASITEQFLDHLSVLEQLDVNVVGDFLEMASMMIEIKSKLLLPRMDEDEEDETPWDDPREQLVQQLLLYKQYRDAASVLEERGRTWSQCFTRLASDLPGRALDPAEQPIHEVELWDLVSALGRVLRANELTRPTSIVYDETPIQIHMENIHRRLIEEGQVAFSDMFQSGMHKSAMIGVFLALLELVRHHCVQAEQDAMHGEIYLKPGDRFPSNLDLPEPDDYQGASKPR